MIWLSVLVAALVALLLNILFRFYLTPKRIKVRTARFLMAGAVLITLCGMHFYGTPRYLADVFENRIKSEDPIFILLAKKDPIHFYEYLHSVQDSFLKNDGNQVSYYTGRYIYNQLVYYSPHASNASFYYLAKATLDLYNKIYLNNPSLVLTLEFNLKPQTPVNVNLFNKTYGQSVDPVKDAKELIIESALTNPQPILSQNDKDRAVSIIQNIMMKLSLNYGNNVVSDTFNNPTNPDLNQKIAAEVIIQFYQMILDRGKDDGGLVVKYIFNNASIQNPALL